MTTTYILDDIQEVTHYFLEFLLLYPFFGNAKECFRRDRFVRGVIENTECDASTYICIYSLSRTLSRAYRTEKVNSSTPRGVRGHAEGSRKGRCNKRPCR